MYFTSLIISYDLKNGLTYDSAILWIGVYWRERKKNLQNDLYSIAYSIVINNEQKQITGNVFNRRVDKLGHIYTTVYLLIRKK